jgi:hypothetical protein
MGGNMPKSRKSYDVSPTELIEAWESSETVQEAAAKLKMPKAILLARASKYRQTGIKLKKMKRPSRRSLDVDALNRQIEEIRRRQKGTDGPSAKTGKDKKS